MNQSRAKFATYAPGILLFICLLIGGDPEAAAPTDAIIEILTVIVCGGILLTKQSREIIPFLLILPLLAMGLIVLQIFPLPIGVASSFWPSSVQDAWRVAHGASSIGFLSLNVGDTISSLVYVATGSILLWTLASLSREQLLGLLPFVVVGVLVNVFASLFQISLTGLEPRENLLPFPITLGLFANSNHFATLMLMTIPPLVYGVIGEFRLPAAVTLGIVLVLLLASGSGAGAGIGLSVAVVSFFLLGGFQGNRLASFGIVALAALMMVVGGWRIATSKGSASATERLEYLDTGLAAVRENPIIGAGFGTFVQTYQIYEKSTNINNEYVNHAHDDYLELVMEGGALAVALLLFYFVMMFWTLPERFNYPLARVSFLSIAVVLVHSAVDYPLRTLAIFFLFIYAHAFMFADHAEPVSERRRIRVKSRSLESGE